MKKIISIVLALCVILSVGILPSVMTINAAEAGTEPLDKVIKAEVKFTNGEEGVQKLVKTYLYDWNLTTAPESLGFKNLEYVYNGTTHICNAPIKGSWKVKYDYLLADNLAGLGTINTATVEPSSVHWKPGTNINADLTANLGEWNTTEVKLGVCGPNWEERLYIALTCGTTAAVDTEKTYTAYYKNIQVVDEAGTVIYNLFDNSVTTEQIQNTSYWDAPTNASMTLSVVDDPNPETADDGGEGGDIDEDDKKPADDGKKKDTIKATVKFTDGTAGTEKYAYATLYGWNSAIFNSYRFSYGDKIVWEYSLGEDAIAGLGTADFQSQNNSTMDDYTTVNPLGVSYDVYGDAYTSAQDMTKIPGYKPNTWITESVTPHEGISALPGNSWQAGIQHVLLTAKTTAAVDTSKEYVVYYRNIRIVDKKGDVKLVLFDGSQELAADTNWKAQNATMKLEKVADPHKDSFVEAPKTERVIKLSVKYTYLKEMQGKTGWVSIFGYATTTATPLKLGDKISYEVMLESPMAGIGALSYQENEVGGGFWQCLHDFAVDKNMVDSNGLPITPDTDLSNVATGKWYTRVMDVANPGREACHWIVGINSTKAAAEEGKEYNAYFRNIKIIHADGTETILFDGTQDVNPQAFGEVKGAELKLSAAELIVSGAGAKSPGTGESNRDTAIVLAFVMILSLAVLSVSVVRRKSN